MICVFDTRVLSHRTISFANALKLVWIPAGLIIKKGISFHQFFL